MKKNHLLIFVLIVCCMIYGHSYGQSITGNTNILSLINESNLIVRGNVVSINSSFREAGRIYSDIEFCISDVYKGKMNKGQIITFTLLGGKVGDITTFSAEYPQFLLNEESILFIKPNPSSVGSYFIDRLREGKFNIFYDNHGDQKVIRDQFEDGELSINSGGTENKLSNRKPISLNDFIYCLKNNNH